MKLTPAADESVPVLIVGGGGAVLTASMLLARQGVEHPLVSARDELAGALGQILARPLATGQMAAGSGVTL